jgi:hypothetical protein
MSGYKAFLNNDGKLTTKYGEVSKYYEIGETYEHKGRLVNGKLGYHYCDDIIDVYRSFPYTAIVVKIEVPEDANVLIDKYECNGNCTNKMRLLELLNGGYKNQNYYIHYKNGLVHDKENEPAIVQYNYGDNIRLQVGKYQINRRYYLIQIINYLFFKI